MKCITDADFALDNINKRLKAIRVLPIPPVYKWKEISRRLPQNKK